VGQSLDTYLNLVYGDTIGYVYLGVKETSGRFGQTFINWPNERNELASSIESFVKQGEVYLSPSIFDGPSGTKDHVLGSRVVWVDFDYGVPTEWNGVPEPNLLIATSEGHAHAYWSLDKFYDRDVIEGINKRLAYYFEADTSGWDANQLLRPPESYNHKRGQEVRLVIGANASYPPNAFASVPAPPVEVKSLPQIDKLPKIVDIRQKYVFPKPLLTLLLTPPPERTRSSRLMAAGFGLAEIGLSDAEILTVLLDFDSNVVRKFVDRPDRLQRLCEIVALSRAKYPQGKEISVSEMDWTPMSLSQVLKHEVTLDWVWEPYLHGSGTLTVSGPPGVGKSQFCLSLAGSLALGNDYLGTPTKGGRRIGFLSLEMDFVEVKYILERQANAYSEAERQILDKNLHIFPFGYPVNFNVEANQKMLEKAIIEYRLHGLIIDSLSSTTPEELSSEKEAKKLFDFNAMLRAKYGIFIIYIHHNRKSQSDNRKPTKLADLHGSVHLAGKGGSVIFLWPEANGTISLISPKVRLGATPPERRFVRSPHLHLVTNNTQLVTPEKPESTEEVPQDDSSKDGGDFRSFGEGF